MKSEDALLYDSVDTGRVYLVDQKGKQWISPHDSYQHALVGSDQNDDIYIARLSGSKTSGSARLADAIMVSTKERAFSIRSVDAVQRGLHRGIKWRECNTRMRLSRRQHPHLLW